MPAAETFDVSWSEEFRKKARETKTILLVVQLGDPFCTPLEPLADLSAATVLLANCEDELLATNEENTSLFGLFDEVRRFNGGTCAQQVDSFVRHSNSQPHMLTFNAAAKLVEGLLRDFSAQVYVSSIEEELQLTLAAIRDEYDLPGAKTNDMYPFVDKLKMAAMLTQCGVRQPYTLTLRAGAKMSAADLPYPLAVKPAAMSGSRGFQKVENEIAFENFLAKRQAGVDYVVQEYVDAKEIYILHAFKHSNAIQFAMGHKVVGMVCEMSRPHCRPCGEFLLPSNHPLHDRIFDFAETTFAKLKDHLHNGAFFIDVLFDGKDYKVLEIASRPERGGFTRMLHHGTGVDLDGLQLVAEVSKTVKECDRIRSPLPVASMSYPLRTGVLRGFNDIPKSISCHLRWSSTERYAALGDVCDDAESCDQVVGVTMFETKSVADLDEVVKEMREFELACYDSTTK